MLEEALGLWRGAAYQGYRYTGFGAAEGERLGTNSDERLSRTASTRDSLAGVRASSFRNSKAWCEKSRSVSGAGAS